MRKTDWAVVQKCKEGGKMKAILKSYDVSKEVDGREDIRISLVNTGDVQEMMHFLIFLMNRDSIFSDETLTEYIMMKKLGVK